MAILNNPRKTAVTATSSATLARGFHTPVNATAAAVTMTLPTTAPAGVEISVEKVDASTNAVNVSGTLRGVASSSIPLTSQYDARTFLSEGAGSWRPTSDHRTASSLDKAYSRNIPPSLELYEHQADGTKIVLFQDGATLYATSQTTAGTVYKSVDYGKTWTSPGATGMQTKVLLKIKGTGTLIAVQDTVTTTAGLNPKVMRSVDDGVNWTQVATLNFPPLGGTGITATPSGYVLIGEYGNIANTSYRVLRSTDDGQTFTSVLASPGTDIVNDPGHIHSVTYDPYANKFIAAMDRPNHTHYVSSDQGATWTLVGVATSDVNQPNWVAPMHFPNHIAWGYDNENNGRIGIIKRTDYYAGNWGAASVAAEVNHKAFYGAFPISSGIWTISGAQEVIGGDPTGIGAGSFNVETFLIDENVSGSGNIRVTGGFSYAAPGVRLDDLKGYKALFPTVPYDAASQGGKSWVNLNVGSGITYATVPYSVGVAPKMRTTPTGSVGSFVIPNGAGLLSRRVDGTLERVIDYTANDRLSLKNTKNAAAPELRVGEDGIIYMLVGGAVVAKATGNPGLFVDSLRVFLGAANTAPALIGGASAPEGASAAAAPPGSIWLWSTTGASHKFYMKGSGTGNTGWVPLGAVVPVNVVTADYTLLPGDHTVIGNGASITLTLPDPSTLPTGREFRVKNSSATALTLISAVGTINGAANKSLAQNDCVTVVPYGTGWHIVAR